MLRRIGVALGLIVLFGLLSPAVSAEPVKGLVNGQWVQDNLPRADVRIIDVRDKISDYWQGHLPGAVYCAPDALRMADHGVPGMLAPPEALAIMLGRMGITPRTTVVVYTEQGDFKAPYLLWALDYLGHPSAVMLDGGFGMWQKEGRPVTQDYPKITPARYPVPRRLRNEVRARMSEVKEVVADGGAVLLDVRPLALYTGEQGPWKRKGHIPGARHHFWGDDLNADGTFKNKADLQQAYEALGATPDKLIIVSCGQGQMSAHSYFTLKYLLGYPRVKNYDGSFNEWSNLPSLPVTIGTQP